MGHGARGIPVATARVRAAAWVIAPVLGAAVTPAWAGDGVRPRTPVIWPADTPCLLEVDRTASATVNLPYALAFEDPMAGASLTEDELEDGRRQQFFAFATDLDPRLVMPAWITWADVMRAATAGLVDAAAVDDDDVLETHALLGGAFVRINADDARRPITFAMADAGVDWDTSAVAPGTYVVRAYTWDPWPNLWAKPRPGAVRVFDDVDAPTLVPALAVSIATPVLHRDELGMIDGCLAAPVGTTLSAAWADFTDPQGPFTEFASGLEADGGTVAIPFAPPEALWGKFAVVRVSAIAPDGRRYDAFVPQSITILASDAPGGCDGGEDSGCAGSSSDDGGEGGAPGTSSSSTTAATGDGAGDGGAGEGEGSTGTTAAPAAESPATCACDQGHAPGRAALLLGLGLLGCAGRRRPRAHTGGLGSYWM